MDQLPRLRKRELICLLLFTCNYVVSVWRGFFFLWVLGMGYIILLWHSLSLPYNYFVFVNIYFNLIRDQIPEIGVVDSFFVPAIEEKRHPEMYVKDALKFQTVLIPVNLNHHWSLVVCLHIISDVPINLLNQLIAKSI